MIHTAIYPKFLQVQIREDYSHLDWILRNAQRSFSQVHRLSNTLLILDDSKKIKKQYFLNWLHYLLESKTHQSEFLAYAHLPIRIKITPLQSLTYRIDAKVRILSHDRVKISLSKKDLRARRCLLALFGGFVFDIYERELVLDGSKEGFWEHLMSLVQERVVGNLVLNLDFQDQSYLTQSELEFEESHFILDSQIGDNLLQIRKKYKNLARKYHPDNVFGADFETVQNYHQKFAQIQSAFALIREKLG